MSKIIGNTTATPNPRPDWNQTDETKADYIKNKPEILTEEDVLNIVGAGGGGSVDLIKIVEELPETGELNKLYLIPKTTYTKEGNGWTATTDTDSEEYFKPLRFNDIKACSITTTDMVIAAGQIYIIDNNNNIYAIDNNRPQDNPTGSPFIPYYNCIISGTTLTITGYVAEIGTDKKLYDVYENFEVPEGAMLTGVGTSFENGNTYVVSWTNAMPNDLFDEYVWSGEDWEYLGTKQMEIDLTNYAKKSDIPDVSNFITEVPEYYMTEAEFETELESKGYLTEHQSLENYATKDYVEKEISTFDFIKVVDTLPKEGLENRIYFVPKTSDDLEQENDLFDEYIWMNIGTEASPVYDWEWITTKQMEIDLTNYVQKEQGKGLSTNDFTNDYKTKLENINIDDSPKAITKTVSDTEVIIKDASPLHHNINVKLLDITEGSAWLQSDIFEVGDGQAVYFDGAKWCSITQKHSSLWGAYPVAILTSDNQIHKIELSTTDNGWPEYECYISGTSLHITGTFVNENTDEVIETIDRIFEVSEGALIIGVSNYNPETSYYYAVTSKRENYTDVKVYKGGKNLFDQSLIPNYTLSGVDVQYLPEEDCFLIHGTATSSNQKMCRLAIEIEPNNQYAISTEHISGSVTIPSGGNAVAYFGFNDDPNAGVSEKKNTNLTQAKSSNVFTVTKKYCNYFWIYYTNGVKFDNYKVRIQLEKNSVATDFEPYIEPTECVVNTDGTANVPSLYPTTRLYTDTEGITITAEYNKYINEVLNLQDAKNIDKQIVLRENLRLYKRDSIETTSSGTTTMTISDASKFPHMMSVSTDVEGVEVYRTGKNLFPAYEYPENTSGGITIKYLPDEDCFELNGTCNDETNRTIMYFSVPIPTADYENDRYTISARFIEGSVTRPNGTEYAVGHFGTIDNLTQECDNWESVNLYQQDTLLENRKIKGTQKRTPNYINSFWFYAKQNVTFNGYKVRIQLEKGTKATSYEKHKPILKATNGEIAGTSPITTLFTHNIGATITAKYNVENINEIMNMENTTDINQQVATVGNIKAYVEEALLGGRW